MATPILVNGNTLKKHMNTVYMVALVLLLTWPDPTVGSDHVHLIQQINLFILLSQNRPRLFYRFIISGEFSGENFII